MSVRADAVPAFCGTTEFDQRFRVTLTLTPTLTLVFSVVLSSITKTLGRVGHSTTIGRREAKEGWSLFCSSFSTFGRQGCNNRDTEFDNENTRGWRKRLSRGLRHRYSDHDPPYPLTHPPTNPYIQGHHAGRLFYDPTASVASVTGKGENNCQEDSRGQGATTTFSGPPSLSLHPHPHPHPHPRPRPCV